MADNDQKPTTTPATPAQTKSTTTTTSTTKKPFISGKQIGNAAINSAASGAKNIGNSIASTAANIGANALAKASGAGGRHEQYNTAARTHAANENRIAGQTSAEQARQKEQRARERDKEKEYWSQIKGKDEHLAASEDAEANATDADLRARKSMGSQSGDAAAALMGADKAEEARKGQYGQALKEARDRRDKAAGTETEMGDSTSTMRQEATADQGLAKTADNAAHFVENYYDEVDKSKESIINRGDPGATEQTTTTTETTTEGEKPKEEVKEEDKPGEEPEQKEEVKEEVKEETPPPEETKEPEPPPEPQAEAKTEAKEQENQQRKQNATKLNSSGMPKPAQDLMRQIQEEYGYIPKERVAEINKLIPAGMAKISDKTDRLYEGETGTGNFTKYGDQTQTEVAAKKEDGGVINNDKKKFIRKLIESQQEW